MYGTVDEWVERKKEIDSRLNLFFEEEKKLAKEIEKLEKEKEILIKLEELYKLMRGDKR